MKRFKQLLTNPTMERLLLCFQRFPFCYTFSFKFIPGNELYPKGSFRQVVRSGIRYSLDISDYQQWLIYFNSEIDSSKNVLNYLKPTDHIIFDIGANIGQTSLWMDAQQPRSGEYRILTFEPFPSTYSVLEQNLRLNPDRRIEPFQLAFGDKIAELQMAEHCATNSGGFRISGGSAASNFTTVSVTTVDAFMITHKLDGADFFKIDVEGYELHVLRGATNTLQKFTPKLYIEYCPENLLQQGVESLELIDFLLSLGYEIRDAHTGICYNNWSTEPKMTDLYCKFP